MLNWSLAATCLFVAVEAIAGFRSHSLSLISDAGHNATDALALLLAAVGLWFQGRPADHVKTFGYQRAGVLAAFVNALTLIVLSIWIFWEAWQRFLHPEPVQPWVMIVVAAAGIVLNGGVMLGLNRAQKDDLNIRAAFLHMLGDLLSSAAIVVGGVLLLYTGALRIDAVLSVAIAALILYSAWDVTKESLNILLEGLPRGLHLHDVESAMSGVDGVLEVHDLHIWNLGSNSRAMSCHVVIEDKPPSESDAILRCLNHVLEHDFQIGHTTVQFEHVGCELSRDGCVIAVGPAHHRHHRQ